MPVNLDKNKYMADITPEHLINVLSLHENTSPDILVTIIEYMDKPMKDIIINTSHNDDITYAHDNNEIIGLSNVNPLNVNYMRELCKVTSMYYEDFDDVFTFTKDNNYVFRFIRPFDKSFYLFQSQVLNFKKGKPDNTMTLKYHIEYGEGVVK